MEAFSLWLNGRLLPDAVSLLLFLEQAVRAQPTMALGLVILAIIAATVARSPLMLIATLTVAGLTIASLKLSEGNATLLVATGAIALALLCLWSVGIRRTLKRQRRRLDALTTKLAQTQSLLDREVEWRLASGDKVTQHASGRDQLETI